VLAGLIIAGLLQIAQMKLTEGLQQRIFAKSSFDLAVRIPRVRLDALQNQYAPELINRFFDTITLQKTFAKLLIDYPTAGLQVFFGLILISVYHPLFLIFSAGLIFVLYLLFKYTGPQGVVTSLKESSHKYEVAHWLEELARTLGTFKLAGVTALPLVRVDKLIMGYLYYRRKHFEILITQYKILVAFKVIAVGVLLVLGSILLIDDQISLGQFVAVEIIIILIMNSIEKLIVGLESVYDLLTSLEKLGSILDLPLEEDNDTKTVLAAIEAGFEVSTQNLNFSYPETDKMVIAGVNMRVPAGKKVALVGGAGSGKSTLLQLLSGIYDNYQGRITYNGIPLTALRHDMLRLQIGDNIWHETIFKGSLRENITIGRENITDEMILEALRVVSAVDDKNFLEDGLNTEILPGGMRIPRSFASKIMLARSIVANPQLILLELEIDYMRQAEKQRFFDYLCQNRCTVIAATTDEDFLQRCDHILFMQLGSIVFEGTYKDYKDSNYAQSVK
jgi:ABC-type bacteriocin/lantibiotic exporter with double-glycine peptidase domain